MAVLRDEQNKQHQEQMTMLQEQIKILQSSLNNPRENVPTPMDDLRIDDILVSGDNALYQLEFCLVLYQLITWVTLYQVEKPSKLIISTNFWSPSRCTSLHAKDNSGSGVSDIFQKVKRLPET